jgi:ubiquinone/menaquinone biosynthesis C-methylase UbiE
MPKEQLYKKYAKFYDKIYSKKEYDNEVKFINSVVKKYKIKEKKLLDVACGTGTHDKKLIENSFKVVGVDINSEMLKIAKNKVKKAKFIKGDMSSLKLKEKFNIIICLFTAINYNKNISELKKTIKNFYNLLNKNGIVIFDLGLTKKNTKEEFPVGMTTYSENNLQIVRIGKWNISKDNPKICNANFLMLVKERGKIDFEIDEHELGIFSVKEVESIMKNTGFKVEVFDDFSLKKYTKNSRRPVFVGEK